MIRQLLSDRERSGLRGPVKSVTDDWSTTEFDRAGKILEWRCSKLRSGQSCDLNHPRFALDYSWFESRLFHWRCPPWEQ